MDKMTMLQIGVPVVSIAVGAVGGYIIGSPDSPDDKYADIDAVSKRVFRFVDSLEGMEGYIGADGNKCKPTKRLSDASLLVAHNSPSRSAMDCEAGDGSGIIEESAAWRGASANPDAMAWNIVAGHGVAAKEALIDVVDNGFHMKLSGLGFGQDAEVDCHQPKSDEDFQCRGTLAKKDFRVEMDEGIGRSFTARLREEIGRRIVNISLVWALRGEPEPWRAAAKLPAEKSK